MRWLALLLLLISAPAYASPQLLFLAATNKGATELDSFEAGTDGWTITAPMDREYSQGSHSGSYRLVCNSGGGCSASKSVTTRAGNLYFWYNSSNAGTYINIDGATAGSWGGNGGASWSQIGPISVTAGTHTIDLRGAYGAYYDDISLPVLYTGYVLNDEMGTASSSNWTVGGSAATYSAGWANSTSPIGGDFLRVTTNATGYVTYYHSFTGASTVYATVAIRRSSLPWGDTYALSLWSSTGTVLGGIKIGATGAIRAYDEGGGYSTPIGTLSTNTWTYLQLRYVAGTAGTAATFTGWVSSDGVNWGTSQTRTKSATGVTADAARVVLNMDTRVGASDTMDADRVRVDVNQISY